MSTASRVHERKVLPAGEVLIREGEDADAAYILQSGALGVYKMVEGVELLLAVLRPGSIVGEMALLDSGRRSATVRALQLSNLIRIPREQFDRKVDAVDPFTRALLQMFTQKVRKLTADLSEAEKRLRSHDAPGGTTAVGGIVGTGHEEAETPADSIWRTAVLRLLRRFYPKGRGAPEEAPMTRDEVYGEILAVLSDLGPEVGCFAMGASDTRLGEGEASEKGKGTE